MLLVAGTGSNEKRLYSQDKDTQASLNKLLQFHFRSPESVTDPYMAITNKHITNSAVLNEALILAIRLQDTASLKAVLIKLSLKQSTLRKTGNIETGLLDR